jgi:Flp pilus assembly pilin Flp
MRRINQYCLADRRQRTGGEVLEYALIAGIIVVAAIAVIGVGGSAILKRYGNQYQSPATMPVAAQSTNAPTNK